MQNNIKIDRRIFLKNVLVAGVFTSACPHILLGNLKPEFEESGNTIKGVYSLDLEQFPTLNEIWGSVRMQIPKLNEEKPAEVIITRLPYDEFKQHFAIVNTLCPHEGNIINDLHPDFHIFDCPGHGTLFEVTGKQIEGYAPEGLQSYLFDSKWVPSMRYLKVLFDFDVASVSEPQFNNPMFYLNNCFPNPFSESTTIEYGVDRSLPVNLSIFDMSGKVIETIFDGVLSAGTYQHKLNGLGIPVGTYVAKLSINGIVKKIIKITKR